MKEQSYSFSKPPETQGTIDPALLSSQPTTYDLQTGTSNGMPDAAAIMQSFRQQPQQFRQPDLLPAGGLELPEPVTTMPMQNAFPTAPTPATDNRHLTQPNYAPSLGSFYPSQPNNYCRPQAWIQQQQSQQGWQGTFESQQYPRMAQNPTQHSKYNTNFQQGGQQSFATSCEFFLLALGPAPDPFGMNEMHYDIGRN